MLLGYVRKKYENFIKHVSFMQVDNMSLNRITRVRFVIDDNGQGRPE